jgi:predicted nucleotidyltransferase
MSDAVRQSSTVGGLSEAAIASILNVLNVFPAVKGVILFGSRAKGNIRPGSDIDLCLEATGLDAQDRLTLETRLDDLLLPWKIDLLVREDIDNPELLAHIARVGIRLAPKPIAGMSDS